jgi:pSer/pThr/pTyr-binding forkhead associated (FHA) protein
MDDHPQLSAAAKMVPHEPVLLPADFVPLSLVLLPKGVRLELTKPDVLVGRHSDMDVRLPLPDVSRRHCRFVFTNSGWQVVDLNSLNGVHLNGKRVAHATLRNGDRLRIGGFLFEVEMPARTRPTETHQGTSLEPDAGKAKALDTHRRAS